MANNRIREMRKLKKVSQRALADLMGVHFVTISKLERGEMQLTLEWLERLAKALKVPSYDLYHIEGDFFGVEVYGYVNDNGSVVEEDFFMHVRNVQPNDTGDEWAFWVEVTGDYLWPVFHKRDLLKFEIWPDSMASDFHDRLCFLRLKDGNELIGILGPSRAEGAASIRAFNGPPQEVGPIRHVAVLVESRHFAADAIVAEKA